MDKTHQKSDAPSEKERKVYSKLDIKRYFLGLPYDDIYLTEKEFQYLKQYVRGKSIKSIANMYLVSPRTVEARLKILRINLNM